MSRIALTLNEAKTHIRQANSERFDFLGYTFGPHRFRKDGYVYLGMSPSKKSVARLRGKVEDLMKPGNVMPWPEVRNRLNATLRGWSGYFQQGDCYPAYRAVNHYVYQRVRVFLRRRHKVSSLGTAQFSDRVVFRQPGCTTSFRDEVFRELMVKSVGKPDARKGHVQFDERGRETGGCQQAPHRALPRLYVDILPACGSLRRSTFFGRIAHILHFLGFSQTVNSMHVLIDGVDQWIIELGFRSNVNAIPG